MVRSIRHISAFMVAVGLLVSSCGKKDEAEVIPRARLARIYAEMLVTDQWITTTPGERMIADTSLVYAPILEKYGYDLDDYLKSMDVYMDDPERFSRILRQSGEIIGKQIEDAEKRLSELQRKAALPKIDADFRPEEFFPYIFEEPYVHYYDSLTFEPDSVLLIYRLIPLERTDTVFDGIRMTVQADSLAAVDSACVIMPDDIIEPEGVATEVADTEAGKPSLSKTNVARRSVTGTEVPLQNQDGKLINDKRWETRE